MKIIVDKAAPNPTMGGTCNCGSNSSGSQGSMCRAVERPKAKTPLAPPLAQR